MAICGCPRCNREEEQREMEAIVALNAAFMDVMVHSFGVDEEKNVELRLERDGMGTTIGDALDSQGCPWTVRLYGLDYILPPPDSDD